MSEFTKKIFSGNSPSPQDWVQHLIETHRGSPAMTPMAFAPYKNAKGFNSYEELAQTLNHFEGLSIKMLDLGCGDGHLIRYCSDKLGAEGFYFGADLVDSEIALAKSQHAGKGVKFFCTPAHRLPIDSNSLDAVLCHMAFMLMAPIQPIVHELGRVLKEGGIFAAVVGGKPDVDSLANELIRLIHRQLFKHYPELQPTVIGDERVSTLEGLRSLFNESVGFSEPAAIHDFDLHVRTTPIGLWDFWKDAYFVGMLSKEQREELKDEFTNFLAGKTDHEGFVKMDFPLRKFEVLKL